nr:MAG TPA: hypothetical protein [Caudoviricetes sp.]
MQRKCRGNENYPLKFISYLIYCLNYSLYSTILHTPPTTNRAKNTPTPIPGNYV